MLHVTARRGLVPRRRWPGGAARRRDGVSIGSGQFRQECQRLRINSALSAVFVFRWRLRKCRRTADAEMPSVAAISEFFWPQQQSVSTSRSRRVRRRHWARSLIARSACGGRQESAFRFVMERPWRAGFSGHAAQTPPNSVQPQVTLAVVVISSLRIEIGPLMTGRSVLRRSTTHSTPINRRGRDSNPRYSFPYCGFQDRRLKPLGHLSIFKP